MYEEYYVSKNRYMQNVRYMIRHFIHHILLEKPSPSPWRAGIPRREKLITANQLVLRLLTNDKRKSAN